MFTHSPIRDVEKTKRSEKSLQPYRFLLNECWNIEKLETINQLIIGWANIIDNSLSFQRQTSPFTHHRSFELIDFTLRWLSPRTAGRAPSSEWCNSSPACSGWRRGRAASPNQSSRCSVDERRCQSYSSMMKRNRTGSDCRNYLSAINEWSERARGRGMERKDDEVNKHRVMEIIYFG